MIVRLHVMYNTSEILRSNASREREREYREMYCDIRNKRVKELLWTMEQFKLAKHRFGITNFHSLVILVIFWFISYIIFSSLFIDTNQIFFLFFWNCSQNELNKIKKNRDNFKNYFKAKLNYQNTQGNYFTWLKIYSKQTHRLSFPPKTKKGEKANA